MAKKHKSSGSSGRAMNELQNMKHRDLQRACVVRGMDFQAVVDCSTPGLSNWFQAHYVLGQNNVLLDEFDEWVRIQLKGRGYSDSDPLLSPSLRLGYIGEVDEVTGKTIIKRPKGIHKPPKPKRERDGDTGLFKGTKKDFTYQCQKDGKDIKETFRLVSEKFPEAQEKSVKIWFNRSKKAAKI